MSVRSASPGGVVPYITLRADEVGVPESMLRIRYDRWGPVGLSYEEESQRDRDGRGALWARVSQSLHPESRLPVGRPVFAAMHPSRQREAMMSLRCQVCLRPADKNELGYLFLEVADDRLPEERMVTSQPPLCLEHAAVGVERCRHLLDKGYLLMRVRVPRMLGVVGSLYRRGESGLPEPVSVSVSGSNGRDTPIPYTQRDLIPWVLATQLVRKLTGVTRVDIDAELAAAAERGVPAVPVRAARAESSPR